MNKSQMFLKIIRCHRKNAGLSQQELAKLAGVGKTSVFYLEKGEETVQLDALQKIPHALNITLKLKGPLMQAYEGEACHETS